MSTLKTQENDGDVVAYLQSVRPERRRKDAMTLLPLFQDVTDLPARMWGDSLVGFGAYDYTYKSGHSGRWPLTGFSPRKAGCLSMSCRGLATTLIFWISWDHTNIPYHACI